MSRKSAEGISPSGGGLDAGAGYRSLNPAASARSSAMVRASPEALSVSLLGDPEAKPTPDHGIAVALPSRELHTSSTAALRAEQVFPLISGVGRSPDRPTPLPLRSP